MNDRPGLLSSPTSAPLPQAASAPVFLGYTQAELDRAYDQTAWAPKWADVEGTFGPASAAVRAAMPPRTEAYGAGAAECLDIFAPPGARGAPVVLFIHGGAWRRGSKDDYSFPAPTFVGRGAVYVSVGYDKIDTAPIVEMAEQCRRAVAWTAANIARFGGDPARIFLLAHSAGSHLGACVLATDWAARGLVGDPVCAAFLISGLYDLYPVARSARGAYMRLGAGDEAALSPMRRLGLIGCPVTVVTADMDTPEFKRQSAVFAEALAGMGRLAGRRELFNTNHFEAVAALAKADSAVSRAVFEMIAT